MISENEVLVEVVPHAPAGGGGHGGGDAAAAGGEGGGDRDVLSVEVAADPGGGRPGASAARVRVLLGGGDGWSIPVSLGVRADPRVETLRAGGLGEGAPKSELGGDVAAQRRGGVFCHIAGADALDAATGQLVVSFWPLYFRGGRTNYNRIFTGFLTFFYP